MGPNAIEQARSRFLELFGGPQEGMVWAWAPGRVNLIGEHTDYHGGLVMPMAIDLGVAAVARGRRDGEVRVRSEAFAEPTPRNPLDPSPQPGWVVRVGAVLASVERPGSPGLDLLLGGDLPVGAGLSSSAASMAAVAHAVLRLQDDTFERIELARQLRRAEQAASGLQCGIMDQVATLCGREGCALLLDCQTLGLREVRLPPEWSVVVLDTGVRHDLASSAYNDRVAQGGRLLAAARVRWPRTSSLRDVDRGRIEALEKVLPEIVVRRGRHVVTENARVLEAAEAFETADDKRLRRAFCESHASLRDDYEVSCKELDQMVALALAAPGCLAARMTGGGFGGCTVNVVERGREEEFSRFVLGCYDGAGTATTVRPSQGATSGVAFPPGEKNG